MKICTIIGSKSDLQIGKKSKDVLDEFGVENDLIIASAHRTPEKIDEIVKKNYDVYIAIAGLAAHLPGVLASKTNKPIIGVPVDVKLDGLDSILSIVQMPPGIPVACMGINNAKNAAIYAIEILAINNSDLAKKLDEYRKDMKKAIEDANREI